MNKLQTYLRRPGTASAILSVLLLSLAFTNSAAGQRAPEPRREQLLNGLRVLLVNRPGDPDVFLKMRVHSGAAFDIAGKEGSMALLTDALFDAETRRYVTEELDGRLDVSITYDSVNVTLAGRASDFDRLLELLRNALINTQLTPEVVQRLREDRIKAVREEALAPETMAERAVAARLFGVHPYGRLVGGSPESLARVERADLLLVRERFLNPNNSTLVIAGAVEPTRVMRALRQSLGGWRKSDHIVPSTFRQPEAPDARTLLIDRAGASEVALRVAVRGLAEADRDRAALWLLIPLVNERWGKAQPQLIPRKMHMHHEAHREGGMFILGATVAPEFAAQALESARAVLRDLVVKAPSVTELEKAKRHWAETLNKEAGDFEAAVGYWLDAHTYDMATSSSTEMLRAVNALTPAEVQRVAARLFLNTPAAAVAVGDASKLREELARAGGVEVFGEAASKPAPVPPVKPSQSQNPSLQLKRP
jgi:predicted Zn-dependent peptidase